MINLSPLKIGCIHLVGIGGIGMSGIAEILVALGYCVQGSDLQENINVTRLRKKGATVFIGQAAENIKGATTVVCSSAIMADNVEVCAAKAANIPVISRAEMLSELMRFYLTVAISGTHGKTTTTSLIAHVMEGLDPTVINGGIINAYGTNTRVGKSNWMVVEADESDATFVRVPSTITVVTNIDPEHMTYYHSFENLKNHFMQFLQGTAFYGFGVICYDHPVVRDLHHQIHNRRLLTYGVHPQATIRAIHVQDQEEAMHFDVVDTRRDHTYKNVVLPMHGHHNMLNALAALTVAFEMGISEATWRQQLMSFQGVKRRFTCVGKSHGVTIIDDYAHHPTEIKAVLQAARSGHAKKITAIVQPHRYSRISDLFMDFVSCLEAADTIYIMPVYAAGEEVIEGVTHTRLVAELQAAYPDKPIAAVDDYETLFHHLRQETQKGTFQIFMGAGDITKYAATHHALWEAKE